MTIPASLVACGLPLDADDVSRRVLNHARTSQRVHADEHLSMVDQQLAAVENDGFGVAQRSEANIGGSLPSAYHGARTTKC